MTKDSTLYPCPVRDCFYDGKARVCREPQNSECARKARMSIHFRALDDERIVYDGIKVTVTERGFVSPKGEEFKREIVRAKQNSVAVVPLLGFKAEIDSDGTHVLAADVALIEQYRGPVDQYLYELPAGKIDPGESAHKAALRELAEETGIRATTLVQLASFYSSPGFTDERLAVFLALDCVPGQAAAAGVEEHHISVSKWSLFGIEDLIEQGTFQDSKTIVGLTLAKAFLFGGSHGT